VLTWLYVPGDRPERFAKAVSSGADTVVVDLEDAVHPDRKAYARAAAAEFCAQPHEVPVQVRINGGTGAAADLEALAGCPGVAGYRVPKVESPATVVATAAAGRPLHLLLESALGVEHAYALATAHPSVASIGLGEADLRSDLGLPPVETGPGEETEPGKDTGPGGDTEPGGDAGLAWARGRVVVAARAAGLPAPAMSVYPHVRDLAGLAASCRAGAALGLLGRAAIHPAQLPVIVAAFRPSATQVRRATELLAALAAADDAGTGTAVLPDGRFADVAMLRAARRTVALAQRYPPD
jgi:citrate lyase subunit beta / citryl-CoA lyase